MKDAYRRIFNVDHTKALKAQGYDYLNGIHYLAPHTSSGVANVCASASPGCIAACLRYSGRGPLIHHKRVDRTVRFMKDRTGYMADLDKGAALLVRRAAKEGKRLALRYDGLSDLGIANMKQAQWGGKTLAERYPDVAVNEYTKIMPRMRRYLRGEFPSNVHYTFSRSELNEVECKEVLGLGGNVAVVFSGTVLPDAYMGRPVINGDLHDLRHLDDRHSEGLIIGLIAKGGPAKRDPSGFVIQLET